MFSNYYFVKNFKFTKFVLENNKKQNVFIVDYKNKNNNLKINTFLKKNCESNFYIFLFANNCKKEINLNITHLSNNSKSNIYAKVFASNNGNIKINCISKANSKTILNKINQKIDGLIIDSNSKIEALPSLDIDTNNIDATHEVNIGQINPEIIFYLNSKGLSKTQSYLFLINNFLKTMSPCFAFHKINISKIIKSIVGR